MKKTPIIIAGIVVVGAAYLGGLYVSGSKALSSLHQVVDRTNASQSKMHLDLQDEQRGLFSSSVKVVAVNTEKKVLVDAPLSLHHHLLSTDIDSHVAVSVDGKNVVSLEGAPDERLLLQAHVKHNQDGRGSSVRISAQGKLLLDSDVPDNKWIEQPDLNISRADDGRLTFSLRERSSQTVADDLQFTDSDSFSSVSYDGAWVDQAIPVIADNIKNDTKENRDRLVTLLFSQLPDTHVEYKQWNLKSDSVDVTLNDLKFDWVREYGATPSSHLAMSVQDANVMNKHYKGAVSLKADQRLIDTLMEAVQTFGISARREGKEALENKVVELVHSTPRLTLENLNVSGEDLKPVSAEGYLTINSNNVKTMAEFEKMAPRLLLGQLSIHGFPEQLVGLAAMMGMDDLKVGDDVKIDTADGHLTVNGKSLF